MILLCFALAAVAMAGGWVVYARRLELDGRPSGKGPLGMGWLACSLVAVVLGQSVMLFSN